MRVKTGRIMKKKATKNITSYLLRQYRKMPGDKKIRLGLKLSQLARIVRKSGALATGA